MINKLKQHFVTEWPTIKAWGLPVIGVFLAAFVPVIGFWVALVGYGHIYPLWKAEREKYQGLKVFALMSMVLSFTSMLGLIYLLTTGELTESTTTLIAHIIKN